MFFVKMLLGPRLLSYGMEQLLWAGGWHATRFLYSRDTTVHLLAVHGKVVLTHGEVVLAHGEVVLAHGEVVLAHGDVVLEHGEAWRSVNTLRKRQRQHNYHFNADNRSF